MALKQDSVQFVLCPRQESKIEGVVLNRVCILGSVFCPKVGQAFKPSAALLYSNIGRNSPGKVLLLIQCHEEDQGLTVPFSPPHQGEKVSVTIESESGMAITLHLSNNVGDCYEIVA